MTSIQKFFVFALPLALTRERHLEAVLNIVSYLQGNHSSRLALDTTLPYINHASFKRQKWVDFYGNVKEAISPNMLEPRGKNVDFIMYADINRAGDKSTRISRTGFLIYTYMALIRWIFKKQTKTQTSFLVWSVWR